MNGNHDPAATADREFVITRTFDAPRDLMFRAWTEEERLKRWWGPKGFTLAACKIDLRPGGVFHYCLQSPGGNEMWGKWTFREVAAPERIVFVSSFSDAEGNMVRAPFSDTWPLEVFSTLTLEERDGQTTVTMRCIAMNATEAERATFEGMFDSMKIGWGGTLDQLAEYLAQG